MKHRWIIVAAYGWLLLQPPPKVPAWTRLVIWLGLQSTPIAESFDPDLDAPYSQWKYFGSYDTAKECESAAAKRVEFFSGQRRKKTMNFL
jgi:hypothetical protein